jgi:two-component system chemotaxis sensor kinase CheA
MNNSQDAFREEAYELLAELETALLELEERADDAQLIDRVFRAMHTIKGSGAMFGFDDIAVFTHELETVFDLVRDGRMGVNAELVNLALAARDQIKAMLDASTGGDPADHAACEAIITALKQMVPCGPSPEPVENPATEPNLAFSLPDVMDTDEHADDGIREETYRIRFSPHPHLFQTGTNPLLLIDELRHMGVCTVMARADAIPPLDAMDPELCYTCWDIVLTTAQDLNAIRDVFIFVEDVSDIKIQKIDEETADHKKIGEILVERGDLGSADLEKVLREQPRIGQVLVSKTIVAQGVVDSALSEQAHVRQRQEQKQAALKSSSIRVASEKLDKLVDLVGELVTVQARLSQKAVAHEDSDLMNIAEVVERLTAELRDNTMSIRMLPIGTTFSKFKRLVRDLSNELGKEVVLTTTGGQTELDKTVIDQLNDPLVHIIRNSIDHGVEPPQIRAAAGKPRQGTVHLTAEHSGANVLICISDDGAGLNAQVIRETAIAKGLITADANKTDRELFNLIFAPGFSTNKTVTSVSGRGVGMDVVKRSIESLRGSIEINSTRGQGTAITLKLPLTLAIIDGLLMQIGKTHFVIPLSSVDECVELTHEDTINTNGRHIMKVRDQIIPYVPLRKLFGIYGDRPSIEQIVITELGGNRIGFVVDQIIGEHQTVIKNLGKVYKDAPGFSGATILADGTVALILDVNGLSEVARMEEGRI